MIHEVSDQDSKISTVKKVLKKNEKIPLPSFSAGRLRQSDFLKISLRLTLDFFEAIMYFLAPGYFDVNRDKYITEIQYFVKEIQIGSGENPGNVTLWQRARREAGSWPIFF